MKEFLQVELEDDAWKSLVRKHGDDPHAICDAIRARFADVMTRIDDPTVEIGACLCEIARTVASCGQHFLQSLPPQTSIFRGGEDGESIYRALCPLLSALESSREDLYGLTLRANALKRELEARRLALMQAEAFAFRAKGLGAVRESFDLCRSLHERCEQTETLLAALFSQMEKVRELEETSVARFLSEVARVADAPHKGRDCDRTRVTALVNQLVAVALRISN